MIWTIAKREILTRGRSKGFLVLTGVLFIGVIAVALIQLFLNSTNEPREVTIGLTGAGSDYASALVVGNDDLAPVTEEVADDSTLVDDETIDVLFDGSTLTWKGFPDNTLDLYIRDTVQQATFAQRADDLNLDPSQLSELFAPVEVDEVRLDGGDDEFGVRVAAAAISGLAIFMLLQIWGSFLMMGVIEEKSSKVVEILLSHVRSSTLLSGKVLGLGILALGQMLIFVLGLVIGLLLVQDVSIPGSVWATVPLSVITFLLGFGFSATAFAAVGSMVLRQKDATSAQLPVMFPLLTAFFIASASISNPENLAVTIGSFLPFTSPALLPFRNATVDVPAWQVSLSLTILAVSIVAMLRIAGWIYHYSLLRTGTRITWTEAWKN